MSNQDQDASDFFRNANGEISESAKMDLEFSNQLLPTETRTKMIDQHLQAIRKQFPQTVDIHYRGAWTVGELIVSSLQKPATECIELINGSEYGPLEGPQELGFGIHLFKFQKPYNPKTLAPIISKLCDATAEPNGFAGDGDNIQIDSLSETEGKYTFSHGWGDCPSGCINKNFWQYSVKQSGDEFVVKLEKEWQKGDDPNAPSGGTFKLF